MFRQFIDTSFNDYRQVRVVVQELPNEPLKQPSSDFERFCTKLFNHKTSSYEQYKLEYCYINETLSIVETPLNEIQLYRRPFAFILFTVCHTSEELRVVLDEFTKTKQQREKAAYTHLFVRYRTTNSTDEDEISNDEKLTDEPEYVLSVRPSISSMASVDSFRSISQQLPPRQFQESISLEDNGSVASDSASLTSSFNGAPIFNAIEPDGLDDDDATASITITIPASNAQSKKAKPLLTKQITLPTTTNPFSSFDNDLLRLSSRLEASLAKSVTDSKRNDPFISSIYSQLADIRLMLDCEKDCSLLESQDAYRNGSKNDRIFKSVLNQFDMRIMQILVDQYLKASVILGIEAGKNKLPKKIIDARTIKRRGDCCLLFGSIEKAYQDYRRAAEVLQSQNDSLWLAAALEGRVAASYLSTQKPKQKMQKTILFLQQNSLTKKLSVDKLLNRSSNTPSSLQQKNDMAIKIYSTANRLLFNKMEFRLELDACIHCCNLLVEQNDIKKYREDIDEYINRINILGSYHEQHIDSIYLNAYIADVFDFIGLKRKSAWYCRSAAFSGLTLLSEQVGYHSEIGFIDELIKRARTGYGIDDNRLIFPLIQKTILNESIQISFKQNDFTTIIENVHFAIKSLIEYMTDAELEALLSFLNGSDQSIPCSYCNIPRLKSLDLLPISNKLKAWKVEPEDNIWIYDAKRALPIHQQSLHRKVGFYWVKNEHTQIALVVENYLPEEMIIDQLEFITDTQLLTKLETKYRIPARTTKRLLINCIPKETGQLQIQGIRYHIWSTDQEYRFGEFPAIRHCSCAIDVVDELPILDVEYLLVNDIKVDLIDKSTTYNAQVYRGEELFVTLGLINSSVECHIDTLNIEVFAFGFDMTESMKVPKFSLSLLINQSIKPTINLTEIYDRCLSRQDRSTTIIEYLTIELRLNYSNTNKYYRRNTIELRLDYLSSITFEINDIQNDEDDLSYLMCCTIDNHLFEEILFENSIIKPSESSLISIKQDKIKLQTFPSDLNQLLTNIRAHLPTHIHYKTVLANKNLRLPIDWQYFSNNKIENHLNDLIQSPYACNWHFERIANTLHIFLCVISKYYKLLKLEFIFPSLDGQRFLNSNKIIFTDIEPETYLMAERVVIFTHENISNVLVADVNVNNIAWKRITLTF